MTSATKSILMPPNGSSLTITNPLILYRSLVATNRIQPDPAQHRLALHLQKLYERLIDYEPASIEYFDRLRQLTRSSPINQDGTSALSERATIGTKGLWTSLLAQKQKRDTLALTRTLTNHEAAMKIQSPKGLMLHGEVGTGKSMLIDLFAESLPNRKKRRWHFNTFMLDIISQLEQLRKSRVDVSDMQDEYSLLWLARDLIERSPILFLDEFQFPDRATSKILSNLMTSFFQLGGVLIATSNRMPEELAKAAGMEFARPVPKLSRLQWRLGMDGIVGRDDGPGQLGEFAHFLEVLRARCEVWEMEGKKDYRRSSVKEDRSAYATWSREAASVTQNSVPVGVAPISRSTDVISPASTSTESILPRHYLIIPLPTASTEDIIIHETVLINTLRSITSTVPSQPLPWTPANLTVYGRLLRIPAQHAGIALFTFDQLCGAVLGPADYVTLASTYHTMIITSVPVLGFSQKNEARRFITLLDATYEARCRLLITAMAGPDHIFFPVPSSSHTTVSPSNTQDDLESDVVYAETYSEIHQDLTLPFRPNISSYNHSTTKHNKLPIDALENNPHNRARRPWSSSKEERKGTSPPDFANIRGLTGADEVFAVRRAESRLWEMCSERWWNRAGVDRLHTDGANGGIMEWWRPLPLALRHWERSQPKELEDVDVERIAVRNKSDSQEKAPPSDGVEGMFAHGASPFRTVDDAPPKIWATHIWGMVKWGKKAGAWGKGVAGLEERNRKQQATHHGSPDDDKKH